MRTIRLLCLLWLVSHSICMEPACRAEEWPTLPSSNATVAIPAQEWPLQPGSRTVETVIHYPGGQLTNVNADTGLMLNLHNWGGTGCAGTSNPMVLSNRLNVVTICVNYLQSGRQASVEAPEPYDCGYLQALDALRALWFVFDRLSTSDNEFAPDRIFAIGGSGGGNVTLMANKLAPRTFTVIVPMCGMAKLSDDIAFNLPGGSGLNARWSRDSSSINYLSPAAQEIRFVAMPGHLNVMKQLGNTTLVFPVHGRDDTTCPFTDTEELVRNFISAGLDVTPIFLAAADLDGIVFTSSGHPLGDRTEIPFRVAGDQLATSRRLQATDFELRDNKVQYPVRGGTFVISYASGYPVGRFERLPKQANTNNLSKY